MKPIRSAVAAIAALGLLSAAPAGAAEAEWMLRVGSVLGKPGTEMPGGTYRVSLPRTDLKVTLDGVEIKPALALGSWLTFSKPGDHGVVMGDLVLTADEVNPVMSKLAEVGIEVTALHNHLLRSEPITLYMHVLGHGDPVALATAMRTALTASRTPLMGAPPSAQPAPPITGLDTAMLDRVLGAKGKESGGVYQFSLPRAEPVKDDDMEVPESMGSATVINFQPTADGKAAITGDFVLTGNEVNPVLGAMRRNGIEITAIHNHMLNDHPRLFFMHFWAHDDARRLADGLKAALTGVNLAKQ